MKRLLTFILLIVAINSHSKVVRFAFSQGQTAPYVITANSGLEVEIVAAALNATGHKLNAVFLPNERMFRMNFHNLDARGITHQKKDNLFYTDEYIYYENFAFTRADDKIKLSKISDLFKYTVGTWKTAPVNLGGDFLKHYSNDKNQHTSKKLILIDNANSRNRMLWRGRVQVVVDDIFIFKYHVRLVEKQLNRKLKFNVHDLWHSRTYYQAGFKDKSLRDDFNKGLKLIKQNGAFDSIIKKYKN